VIGVKIVDQNNYWKFWLGAKVLLFINKNFFNTHKSIKKLFEKIKNSENF